MRGFTAHSIDNYVYTLYGFSLTLVPIYDSELISSARVEDVEWSINGSVLTCNCSLAALLEANVTASITILIGGII